MCDGRDAACNRRAGFARVGCGFYTRPHIKSGVCMVTDNNVGWDKPTSNGRGFAAPFPLAKAPFIPVQRAVEGALRTENARGDKLITVSEIVHKRRMGKRGLSDGGRKTRGGMREVSRCYSDCALTNLTRTGIVSMPAPLMGSGTLPVRKKAPFPRRSPFRYGRE